jgi:hypothetical protein
MGVGVNKKWHPLEMPFLLGAKNGTRTRDPDLGKVVLYQLSYFRLSKGSANIVKFDKSKSIEQKIF